MVDDISSSGRVSLLSLSPLVQIKHVNYIDHVSTYLLVFHLNKTQQLQKFFG